MSRVFVFALMIVLTVGCKKSVAVSDCIEGKINTFKTQGLCSNASVKEYQFQGKLVYVFSVGNCPDAGAAVFDSDCNFLGSLGGFIANSQINAVDFDANAKYKRTIWHN